MTKKDQNLDLFDMPELTPGSVDGAMADAGAQRPRGTYAVPRDKIRVIDGFNIRNAADPEYKAHIRALANSMKANGYMQDKPLAGYVAKDPDTGENVIYLTDGHSRLAAVDLANSEGCEFNLLPLVVKPKGTSMEDLTVALYTSNSGKPLTTFETAMLCKRLLGFGMTEKQIAERLGFKAGKKYVDDLLSLVAAPKELRDMVANGSVGASLAIATIKDVGPAKAAKKLEKAVEKAKAEGKTKVTPKAVRADKHIDDIMVDALAKALKAELKEQREAGKSGWEDPEKVSAGTLLAKADMHGKAGYLIKQIAYLGMLYHRGVTADDIQSIRWDDAAASHSPHKASETA